MTKQVMGAKRYLSLLVSMLMLLTHSPSSAQGPDSSIVVANNPSLWAAACSGVNCDIYAALTDNNYLSVKENGGLSVYPPDGSPPLIYPMPEDVYDSTSGLNVTLFGDQYGIVYTWAGGQIFYLYRWDISTDEVRELPLGTDFYSCRTVSPSTRHLVRIGDSEQVVACTDQALFLVDLPSESVTQISDFPELDDPAARFWQSVVGGLDGNIYVQLFAHSHHPYLTEHFPGIEEDYGSLTAFILKRAPQDAQWSLIAIPEDSVTTTVGDLLAVDEAGNLYFHYENSVVSQPQQYHIIKRSPQGETIWHYTGDGLPSFSGLLGENNILLYFDGVGARIIEIKELPLASADPDQTLTITDDDELTASAEVVVTVEAAPEDPCVTEGTNEG